MILEICRSFFRRCRSTLTAKVANIGPPQLASQKDKKRESSCRTILPSINKVCADDENSSPYASNSRLSAHGHNVAHLTGSTTAEITAFREKIAAVNLNSLQKFYDTRTSVVVRRLTVVSAELLAILEK